MTFTFSKISLNPWEFQHRPNSISPTKESSSNKYIAHFPGTRGISVIYVPYEAVSWEVSGLSCKPFSPVLPPSHTFSASRMIHILVRTNNPHKQPSNTALLITQVCIPILHYSNIWSWFYLWYLKQNWHEKQSNALMQHIPGRTTHQHPTQPNSSSPETCFLLIKSIFNLDGWSLSQAPPSSCIPIHPSSAPQTQTLTLIFTWKTCKQAYSSALWQMVWNTNILAMHLLHSALPN